MDSNYNTLETFMRRYEWNVQCQREIADQSLHRSRQGQQHELRIVIHRNAPVKVH